MSTLQPQMVKSQAIEDLIHILTTNSSGDVRSIVEEYLATKTSGCPTPRCQHRMASSYLCLGYYTLHYVVQLVDDIPQTRKTGSQPLVQEVFCNLFSRTDDERTRTCSYCAATEFSKRRPFDGLFCHGCGFFIDFSTRTLGYSEEWTTRSDITLGIHVPGKPESCTECGSPEVTAKFGDYYFCSTNCMREWYESRRK